MLEIIEKTGVGPKEKGQGLSADDVNRINNAVNSCVEAVNAMLKADANVNFEEKAMTKTYTLLEAAEKIPASRRSVGLRVRFKEYSSGRYVEYTYIGSSVTESEWGKESNWASGLEVIDGGEW